MNRFVACSMALCLAFASASPVFAEKPDNPGQGKGRGAGASDNNGGAKNGQGQGPQGQGQGQGKGPSETRFVPMERDRIEVRTYYRGEFEHGSCPPGLDKKNNGCLPPGQAKKLWVVGQPLPPSVVYYPLPSALVVRLTPPPSGYQYVRVANDILLLAIGTRLVVDALADLSSL